MQDDLLTPNPSDATLRCRPTCHAHMPSSTFSETASNHTLPALPCTSCSAVCIGNILCDDGFDIPCTTYYKGVASLRCQATCSGNTVYLQQTRQVLRCNADQHAMLTGHRQHLAKPQTITYGPHRHVHHDQPFASRTSCGDDGFDIPCISY